MSSLEGMASFRKVGVVEQEVIALRFGSTGQVLFNDLDSYYWLE